MSEGQYSHQSNRHLSQHRVTTLFVFGPVSYFGNRVFLFKEKKENTSL